jgi:hypothetical protein
LSLKDQEIDGEEIKDEAEAVSARGQEEALTGRREYERVEAAGSDAERDQPGAENRE